MEILKRADSSEAYTYTVVNGAQTTGQGPEFQIPWLVVNGRHVLNLDQLNLTKYLCDHFLSDIKECLQ